MASCADTYSEQPADVSETSAAPHILLVPGWPWTALLGPAPDVLRQFSYSVLVALGWGVLGQDWRIVPATWCARILLNLLIEPVIALDEHGIGTFARSRARRGPFSSRKTTAPCTLIRWRDVQTWRRARWRRREAIVIDARTGRFVLVPAGDTTAARAHLENVESWLRERTVVTPAPSG